MLSQDQTTARIGHANQAADMVRVGAVHRNIYLDPDLYRQEMKDIFEQTWVYIGHESEIANAGDFKTTTIGTSPIILCRDEDGKVHVLMNRCRHRGATVCQDDAGNTNAFRCEYHAWVYGIDGGLRGVPYPSRYGADFDKSKLGLMPAARVGSYRGFVFASLAQDGQELTDYLGKACQYLDLFVDASPEGAIEAKHGAHKYYYEANWKFQLENSLDGYHPYFVHRSFFDLQDKRTDSKSTIFSDKSTAVAMELGNGHAVLDQRNIMNQTNTYFHRVKMAPGGPELIQKLENERGEAEARRILNSIGGNGFNLAIFPNLVIIGVQIRVIRPVSVGMTHVDVFPTTCVGVPDPINDMRLRTHEAFFGPAGFGAPDDLEIFERAQAGIQAEPVEWLLLNRGLEKETYEDGLAVGQITDETPQRAMYKEWFRLMVGSPGCG